MKTFLKNLVDWWFTGKLAPKGFLFILAYMVFVRPFIILNPNDALVIIDIAVFGIFTMITCFGAMYLQYRKQQDIIANIKARKKTYRIVGDTAERVGQ
jgi:hypothetical protein